MLKIRKWLDLQWAWVDLVFWFGVVLGFVILVGVMIVK